MAAMLMGLTATAQEFYKGADVGWMTEMESRGHKWYNAEGKETECLQLMKEYDINAVRLRVWVDPSKHGNWCNLDDVIVKAKRAQKLGMEIMLDFLQRLVVRPCQTAYPCFLDGAFLRADEARPQGLYHLRAECLEEGRHHP